MTHKLEPKLLTVLREGYSARQFAKDLMAGITVGVVALPLAIAFAIASGVKPEQGLYTAVVAGFIISVLSGSRVQIGGPTGAFIVIVYGIVQQYGYDGLAVATLMAGGLLLLMGFAGIGAVIKYIPHPITVGFTSGIALIIATSQVRDFLGLRMSSVPADFLEKILAYAHHLDTFDLPTIAVGLLSLLLIVLTPRWTRRVPGSLVAILVATAVVHLFHVPVETIGTRFGSVPDTLPSPHGPVINGALIKEMFRPALSIAFLAGIESLLSAVVADGMLGTRHRSNMELIAQGFANIASPIFGGIPATGAIARTATNIKSGGRTPIAGIVHALTLLVIMLAVGKWAALIPMATLAAILLVVAWNMSERHLFVKVLRSTRSDAFVLLNTFLLTVFVDLTVAIEVGMVLAAFLFMHRMANITQARYVTAIAADDEEESSDPNTVASRTIPKGVEVFEVNGPLFFAVASKFKDAMAGIEKPPRVLILRVRHVLSLDATALRVLEEVYESSKRNGTTLVLSGVHSQPLVLLTQSGFLDRIGIENVAGSLDEALDRARVILGAP